jgi:hypothetical protein
MFVGDIVMLDVSFPAARTGLARLSLGGLLRTSQDAYRQGGADLARGELPGILTLTRVQARPLARTRDSAGLAIRWQVAGPGGPFSVLDADLGLVPAGEHGTLLTLAGTYRPLPGPAIDPAILHQAAAGTIGNFLSLVAAGITTEPGPAIAALAESAPRAPRCAPERP